MIIIQALTKQAIHILQEVTPGSTIHTGDSLTNSCFYFKISINFVLLTQILKIEINYYCLGHTIHL